MSSTTLDPRLPLSQLQSQLQSRLLRVRRAIRGRFAAEALARTLMALTGVAALSLWLDWWLELSRLGRGAFALFAVTAIGWVIWRSLIQPLAMGLEPLDVAAAIDRRKSYGEVPIAPRVAAVLQLPDHLQQPRGSSIPMIESAVRTNFAQLQAVDFSQSVSTRHLFRSIVLAAAAVVIPIAFAAAAPETASLWAARWLNGSDQPWPRTTHLEVLGLQDGKFIVPRGEPASLQVVVTDEQEPTEVVYMRLQAQSGRDETVTLTRFEPGDFRYDLPPLQQDVRVTIWGGDARTASFTIVPVDRPRIVALRLTASHPRLKQPSVHHFRGEEGTVRLLPETNAELLLEANVPVSHIDVETTSGTPLRFDQTSPKTFRTRWKHQAAVQMQITLTSPEAGLVSHPRPVTIGERPDRAPRLSLRHTGVRQRVTPTATIPLTMTARDDFGVRALSVHFETPQRGVQTNDGDSESPRMEEVAPLEQVVYGPIDPSTDTTVESRHTVELAKFGLAPGGVLTVEAAALDDCFTGSQSATSRKSVFRVVKPEELFKEILLRQQQLRSRLRKQYEASIELRDDIRVSELPEDASRLLRVHQLIRREVGQIATALEASALEMKLNKLGGPETWNLIETSVLNPLRTLHDSQMEVQRRSLAEFLTEPSRNAEEILADQQSIVDALKRILDNMAQWDSFIDVVNQLNTVIKLETRVRRQTEELRSRQVESIFD